MSLKRKLCQIAVAAVFALTLSGCAVLRGASVATAYTVTVPLRAVCTVPLAVPIVFPLGSLLFWEWEEPLGVAGWCWTVGADAGLGDVASGALEMAVVVAEGLEEYEEYKHGGQEVAEDDEDADPLQDFHITVPSSAPNVRVCVRDHECEDGDSIRVSVNGKGVFNGELYNRWDCRDVRVRSGRNSITLYAVNGTGYKGNCSHADTNTGQIRVTGKNSETQSWQHRGGAGSKANIVVDVE